MLIHLAYLVLGFWLGVFIMGVLHVAGEEARREARNSGKAVR